MRIDTPDSLWTCLRVHSHTDGLIVISNMVQPDAHDERVQSIQTNERSAVTQHDIQPESASTSSQKSLCLFGEPFTLFGTSQEDNTDLISGSTVLKHGPSSQQFVRFDEAKGKEAAIEETAASGSIIMIRDAQLDAMHPTVSSEHDGFVTVSQTSTHLHEAQPNNYALAEGLKDASRSSSPYPQLYSTDSAASTASCSSLPLKRTSFADYPTSTPTPPLPCSSQIAVAPSNLPDLQTQTPVDESGSVDNAHRNVSAGYVLSGSIQSQPATAKDVLRQLDSIQDRVAATVPSSPTTTADTMMRVVDRERRPAPLDPPAQTAEPAIHALATPADHIQYAKATSQGSTTESGQNMQDAFPTKCEVPHENATSHTMSGTTLSTLLFNTRDPPKLPHVDGSLQAICVDNHADASFTTLPDVQPPEPSGLNISASFPPARISSDDPLPTLSAQHHALIVLSTGAQNTLLSPTDMGLRSSPASAVILLSAPAFAATNIGTEHTPAQLLPSAEISVLGRKRPREHVDEDDILSPEPPPVKKSRFDPSPQVRKTSWSTSVAENHARAFKKLARPFRSPVVATKSVIAPTSPVALRTITSEASTPPRSITATPTTFKKPVSVTSTKTVSRLVTSTSTSPVSAAYRSPVFKKLTPSPGGLSSGQPNTRGIGTVSILTIQALERRVQALKRALKIMADGGDDELEMLAHKWRAAARSASWDLWDCVKNGTPAPLEQQTRSGYGWADGEKDEKDKQRGWQEGWGWDDKPDDEYKPQEASDQPEEVPMNEDEQEEEPQEPTLGKMLMELGIAPDTLGWQEEEGDFRDKS